MHILHRRGRASFLYPCLSVFICGYFVLPAWGQAVPSKEPSSTHIFPAGGRRGTVVPVRVGAECLPPGANLHVWGTGVTAPAVLGPRASARYEPSPRRKPADADGGAQITYPKEWASKMTIAADAPLGPVQWRLTCGWGGTQPRPFLVGDLPEFIETEPNSDPEHAERLTLPVTVNGQIAGERDVDCYVFTAKAGDVVVCDVLASRIGSPLDPVVEVQGPRGRHVPLQTVRVGNDPVIAFKASTDGDYLLNIAHVGVRGGPEYVYRMTLSTAPYVPFAFPPGGHAGETREVRLFALTGGDELRTWKEKITFPADRLGVFSWRGIPLDVSDAPVVVAEGNHSADKALSLTLPVTVSGRFLDAKAEDWFRIPAKKGEAITLVCRPFPAVSAACPVLTLEDAAGHPLARASGAEAVERECNLEWRVPADGVYRLRVRDLQHGARGGPEFLYRLSLRPARPDFALGLTTDYLNVMQDGKAELDVIVRRTGGFTGAIDLSVTGLPAGVRVEPARIAEHQTQCKLILSAGNVRPANVALRLTGKADMGGKPCQRVATVQPVGGPEGVCGGLRNDTLHLTVQHKPIFRLTCNEAYQYASRGTIYPYLLQVERQGGFDGEIVLQIGDRQVQDLDGIEVRERIVPPGTKQIGALIYLPETMHANVQHHCRPYVQGYAFFTDKWGQKQSMLALCDKRCMIRTLPPMVKLKAAADQVIARPGTTVTCNLVLERTSNFAGPMEVELVDPDAQAGFVAEKVRIEPGQNRATVSVRVAKTAMSRNLKFRATGRLPGDVTVVTEATVAVKVE
ncbi:MAG: hypothetical protein HYS12_07635 [Planctomycetes bacterium]|nr:hypothetical protein [Planctomycetota bacterium]